MKVASTVADLAAFGTDLRRYLKVISSLFIREIQNRQHDPFFSILEIFEPVVMLGTVLAFKYVMDAHTSPYGDSMLLFYASGFYPKYLWIWTSRYFPRGTPRRRFPTEQRLDYIIVHLVTVWADYIILGLAGFAFIYFFITPQALPFNFIPVIGSLAAMVGLAFGWGVICVSLNRLFRLWIVISMGLNRALIIVSGALYVPDFMPPNFRYWVSFNPMLHGVALFRTGIYPGYPRLVLDTSYLTYCVVASILIGLVLERVTRRSEVA
jgi:capsular polysaccharide transport system permease protein